MNESPRTPKAKLDELIALLWLLYPRLPLREPSLRTTTTAALTMARRFSLLNSERVVGNRRG